MRVALDDRPDDPLQRPAAHAAAAADGGERVQVQVCVARQGALDPSQLTQELFAIGDGDD
jgi:hypothetical protein